MKHAQSEPILFRGPWRKLIKKITNALRGVVVSFEHRPSETAMLYVGNACFTISRNTVTGFVLMTPDGSEFTVCEENAIQELHLLLTDRTLTRQNLQEPKHLTRGAQSEVIDS